MKHAYILFWIFSAIFIIGGIYIACSNIIFYKNADIVTGTVLRYDKQERKGENWYAAVFSYSIDGVTQETTSTLSSSAPENKNIGQKFKVAISKKDFKKAKLVPDLIKEILLFGPGFIIGGLVSFALGFFFSPYIENKVFCGISVGVIIFLLFFVAIGLCGVGTWILYSNKTFFKNAVIIQGTVIGYESHISKDDDGRKRTMYAERVAYTFNGVDGEIISNTSSNHRGTIGQSRKVGVNPNNPHDARIYSGWENGLAAGLICVGLLLLFIFSKAFRLILALFTAFIMSKKMKLKCN